MTLAGGAEDKNRAKDDSVSGSPKGNDSNAQFSYFPVVRLEND